MRRHTKNSQTRLITETTYNKKGHRFDDPFFVVSDGTLKKLKYVDYHTIKDIYTLQFTQNVLNLF